MKTDYNKDFWEFAYKVRYESRISDDQTKKEVDFLLRFLPQKGKILDFACGSGRHSFLLSESGLEVSAYDNDIEAIGRAIRKAKGNENKTSNLSFSQQDLQFFEHEKEYDGAVCLYSSIGASCDDINDKLWDNFLKSVKKGGVVIVDLMNPQWAEKHLISHSEKDIDYNGNKYHVIHKRSMEHKPFREVNKIIINVEGKENTNYLYTLRLYDEAEITQILKDHGYNICNWFGSYDMEPVSPEKQRLIVVARHNENF